FAVNGGQIARPAADSVLAFGLSPSNRYRTRPLASTRTGPSEVWSSASAEPEDAAVLALEDAAILGLPQPVAATNAATTAAARIGAVGRAGCVTAPHLDDAPTRSNLPGSTMLPRRPAGLPESPGPEAILFLDRPLCGRARLEPRVRDR